MRTVEHIIGTLVMMKINTSNMPKKVKNLNITCYIVASKILDLCQGVQVLINEVPKEWVDYEIYC